MSQEWCKWGSFDKIIKKGCTQSDLLRVNYFLLKKSPDKYAESDFFNRNVYILVFRENKQIIQKNIFPNKY